MSALRPSDRTEPPATAGGIAQLALDVAARAVRELAEAAAPTLAHTPSRERLYSADPSPSGAGV